MILKIKNVRPCGRKPLGIVPDYNWKDLRRLLSKDGEGALLKMNKSGFKSLGRPETVLGLCGQI